MSTAGIMGILQMMLFAGDWQQFVGHLDLDLIVMATVLTGFLHASCRSFSIKKQEISDTPNGFGGRFFAC